MTGEWFAAWATDALAPTHQDGLLQIKTWLRKAAARTPNDRWRAIGEAIDRFIGRECQNYFAAAGYDAF